MSIGSLLDPPPEAGRLQFTAAVSCLTVCLDVRYKGDAQLLGYWKIQQRQGGLLFSSHGGSSAQAQNTRQPTAPGCLHFRHYHAQTSLAAAPVGPLALGGSSNLLLCSPSPSYLAGWLPAAVTMAGCLLAQGGGQVGNAADEVVLEGAARARHKEDC